MKVGDYVLFDGTAWRVIKKHNRYEVVRTWQIKTLYPLPSGMDNIEVTEDVCEVINKEVADVFVACKPDVYERWNAGWTNPRGVFGSK